MNTQLDEIQTATVLIENGDHRKWMHAVSAALIAQDGTFEPIDDASRARLLEAIRSRGYPHAEMDYQPPVGGSLPRIVVRRGSSSDGRHL